ncbi:MAG: Ppx/GppA phosphatase family protein [Candidatus Aureabacteria bacterium]|nr:Ppx/GppA phosphatase family protein [Candidatus Auribacterota bacterium]
MRACAIDIGTNSVRLLVAEIASCCRLTPLATALRITRLGQGIGRRRMISPEAAERTLAAVAEFLETARRHNAERCILFGTAAIREAENGGVFTASVRARTGHAVRILSGEEEAILAYRGATRGLVPHGADAVVIDIGGGSAEISLQQSPGKLVAKSVPIGCVRLTEQFCHADPPDTGELDELKKHISGMLARDIAGFAGRGAALIGAGGTVTTAAAIALGMIPYDPARVHGSTLARLTVSSLAARLAAMPLSQRKLVPGLEPERADVIVAGLLILDLIMDFLSAGKLTVSDEGVLHGALLEMAGSP